MQEDYKTVPFGLRNDDYEETCKKLEMEGYVYYDTVYNDDDPSYGYRIYKK